MIFIHDFYDDWLIACGESEQELIDTWHLQAKDSLDFILDKLSDDELYKDDNLYNVVTKEVQSFDDIIKNIKLINEKIDIAYIDIIRIDNVCKDASKDLEDLCLNINAKIEREEE